MNEIRRKPSLIELQTFMSDGVRIVNDRPLTTVSDMPNDLAPLCPSTCLGRQLASYTSVGTLFCITPPLRKDFGTVGPKDTFRPCKNVGSGEFLGKTFHQVNWSWSVMRMIFRNVGLFSYLVFTSFTRNFRMEKNMYVGDCGSFEA